MTMVNRAVLDRIRGGYRIFVGDLGSRIGKNELERQFKSFGPITDIWVARNPPGFAFLVFKYPEDAERAVRDLDGRSVSGRRVRVEHARPYQTRKPRGNSRRRGMGHSGGHWRREDHTNTAVRSRSRDRSYSRSRRSPYSRSRSRSRFRSYSRSRSPEKLSRSRGGHSSLDIPQRHKKDEHYRSRSNSRSQSPPLRPRLFRVLDDIEESSRQRSPRNRSVSPDDQRSKYSSRSRHDASHDLDNHDGGQSDTSEQSGLRKEKLTMKNSRSRSPSYDGSDLETGEISDHPMRKSRKMKVDRSPSPDRSHAALSSRTSNPGRSDSDEEK
ncbi:arginine-rich splicing factor 7-like [Octopus vulgaris]|uniref:Arginine-rich splicing factor 7-like n=2 Tax=Octopus TaxID=6643 RepID=A0AA36B302_OCTVU|nr:probable splicing factor, arginine/serine-rich 6 isoform X3 [Octopus sinensis]CAI9725702.1 arginine-rich splicing factor 7-like [Octopus vulgaris]